MAPARSKRRLAPRDAFVGVRQPAEDAEPQADSAARGAGAAEPAAKVQQGPTSEHSAPESPAGASSEVAEVSETERLRELAKTLRSAARGYAEKLTIYLPGDVSEKLADLWRKARKETGVKLGKATLVQAALAIVLEDSQLRIAAVERALKARLGG